MASVGAKIGKARSLVSVAGLLSAVTRMRADAAAGPATVHADEPEDVPLVTDAATVCHELPLSRLRSRRTRAFAPSVWVQEMVRLLPMGSGVAALGAVTVIRPDPVTTVNEAFDASTTSAPFVCAVTRMRALDEAGAGAAHAQERADGGSAVHPAMAV